MLDIESENKDFMILLWEGEPFKSVHKKRFGREVKNLMGVKTLNELKERFHALENKVIVSYVQAVLAVKSFFRCELERKLKEQKFSLSAIKKALDIMEKYGFLDDEVYKKQLVRSYLKKGYGERLIEQKLYAKLQDKEQCKVEIEGQEGQEREKILYWLNKRGIQQEEIKNLDPKERKKHSSFLMRKGFSSDAVYQIMFDF